MAQGILILGIGNVLWADEGFGVRAVEALNARYRFDARVNLLDGGTQGLYLLEHVKAADRALVFDAIDFGLTPGTLKVLRDDEVPAWGAAKTSFHQVGFQEVLSLAQLAGRYPRSLALIGVQPQLLADFGGSLTPVVKARVDEAVQLALGILAEWGVPATARDAQSAAEPLGPEALDMRAYEDGRPPEDAACRVGDARFLNRLYAPGGD
jgi:hydrogenase maturation protease